MAQATTLKPAVSKTCSECPHFNNLYYSKSKGWCELFNQPAKTHHEQTNNCILNSEPAIADPEDNLATFGYNSEAEVEELQQQALSTEIVWVDSEGYPMNNDLPHSEYKRGDTVKIIDSQEHYSEWATFKITECHPNPERYRNKQSYLSEPDWFYSISSINGNIPFLVSEIEICDAEMSWNINTSN